VLETESTKEHLASSVVAPETAAPSGRRWAILALLFLVALINYFDRQSLSVVAPRFQGEFHLSDTGYGHIVSLFLFASTIAYALSGFVSDAFGTRWSMALFVGGWSLAEAATAIVRSVFQLGTARFFLGLGEPGLWVAAPKAVGEVFPPRERSLAVGVYTMGATIGAVIAIPAISAITFHWPWKSIFFLDGLAGLLWIPLWLFFFPRRSAASTLITAQTSGALREVLSRGKTWRLLVARAITDPVWYFYLFWFPKYLLSARHLSLSTLSHIGWTVYLAAGVGTLLGGLFSGYLIRRGLRPSIAYRRAMLCAAVLIPVSPLAALVSDTTLSVGIACLMAFAHMAWLVNLTATIVDLYPPHQVGKAAGLIAAGSGFGGMVSSELIAHAVTHSGYTPVFFAMALLHPIAITLLWPAFLDTAEPQPALSAA
jgi:MFS transporter, ACS family, hexuronate transporter